MLQALRQSGASAIFVTHDRDELYATLIKSPLFSKVKFYKSIRHALYWSPNHLETAKFMGESIVLPANLLDENTAQCQLGNIPIKINQSHKIKVGFCFVQNNLACLKHQKIQPHFLMDK